MVEDVQVVGKRIAYLRDKMGLSQVEFAKRFHVSPSAIAMWELGEREVKSSVLARLADFFGVNTEFLLGRTDNPKPVSQDEEAYIDPDIQAQLLRIQEKSKQAHIQGALPRSSSQASLKKHLDTYETILDEIIKERGKR